MTTTRYNSGGADEGHGPGGEDPEREAWWPDDESDDEADPGLHREAPARFVTPLNDRDGDQLIGFGLARSGDGPLEVVMTHGGATPAWLSDELLVELLTFGYEVLRRRRWFERARLGATAPGSRRAA